MPKQCKQQNDRQRDTDKPEQSASSKSHVSLLSCRNNNTLTNVRFRDTARSPDAKRASDALHFFATSKDIPKYD